MGSTVNTNGINNISLQLNDQGGKYIGAAGDFDVYFVPDSATSQTSSSLTYSANSPSGFLASQYNTSGFPVSTLLGTFSFNPKMGYDTYTLASSNTSIGTSVETTLVNDLNSGTGFRLAVTPRNHWPGSSGSWFLWRTGSL